MMDKNNQGWFGRLERNGEVLSIRVYGVEEIVEEGSSRVSSKLGVRTIVKLTAWREMTSCECISH